MTAAEKLRALANVAAPGKRQWEHDDLSTEHGVTLIETDGGCYAPQRGRAARDEFNDAAFFEHITPDVIKEIAALLETSRELTFIVGTTPTANEVARARLWHDRYDKLAAMLPEVLE